MKKILTTALLMMCVLFSFAQGKAEIKFDKTKHDFGTFPEDDAKVTCVFSFENVGKSPLVIHQAVASCGCTVPSFTKEPINPGGKGEIKVTYDGTGRFPGHFKKTITIHSNAKNEMVRVYIEGDMTPKDLDLKKAIEEVQKQSEGSK